MNKLQNFTGPGFELIHESGLFSDFLSCLKPVKDSILAVGGKLFNYKEKGDKILLDENSFHLIERKLSKHNTNVLTDGKGLYVLEKWEMASRAKAGPYYFLIILPAYAFSIFIIKEED